MSLTAVAAIAATLFVTACGSSGPANAGHSDPTTSAPTTTAAAGGTISTAAAGGTISTSAAGGTISTSATAKAAELPKACDVLTAAEVTAATGITVTATPDSAIPTACNYNAGTKGIITMTVSPPKITTELANGFLKFPKPGITYKPVDGVGVVSAVSGPPEGRLIVATATAGFDVARAGGSPLSEEQLVKIAKAIVA